MSQTLTAGPKLYLPFDVQTRLGYYARGTSKEISGLGEISFDLKEQAMRVEQLHLLEQECSGSETTLKPEALHAFLLAYTQNGANAERLRFHWHSHCAMSVFWSSTDDTFCQGWQGPWFVALVTNHKGEYLARLEIRDPFTMTLPMPVFLEQYHDPVLAASIQAEIDQKVKEPPPFAGNYGWNYSNGVWTRRQLENDELEELVKDFSEKQGRQPTRKERKALRNSLRRWTGGDRSTGNLQDDDWNNAMDAAFNEGYSEYSGV